jgi:hypothetical protein
MMVRNMQWKTTLLSLRLVTNSGHGVQTAVNTLIDVILQSVVDSLSNSSVNNRSLAGSSIRYYHSISKKTSITVR